MQKVMLVSGANVGIGLATVIGLARSGARVLLHARDRVKGIEAVETARRAAGSDAIDLLLADLRARADIDRMVTDIKRRYDRLDVLVNNAAIVPAERTLTEEGLETQFAVNHLAAFRLTMGLLDMLAAGGAGRVVVVSSEAHRQGRIVLDDLQSARTPYHINGYPVRGWQAYSNTKLMNVLFANELARRMKGAGVVANSLHPGVIGTQLVREWPRWVHNLYKAIMPGPARGARTSLYLALAPEAGQMTGAYLDHNQRQSEPLPAAREHVLARRLWEASEDLAQRGRARLVHSGVR